MFKRFKEKKRNNKGFTLVELVVVVAILAILVGLLAPQYTKYVERAKKSTDASNMDEIVKAVEIYAADPVKDLAANSYDVIISETGITVDKGIEDAVQETVPDYASKKLKSFKWGANGAKSDIYATIVVDENGGTEVSYGPDAFNTYVDSGKKALATKPTIETQ